MDRKPITVATGAPWVLAGCLVAWASPAAAQNLLDPPPKMWVAPGQLFSVDLPPHWKPAVGDNPHEVQIIPAGSNDARLYIRRIQVPRGANPLQLALRAVEDRLSKLPAFKLLKKRKMELAGQKAASVIGTYAHQGNIQYPRVIEEIYMVYGGEAFILHFDCFEPAAARYASALNKLYGSFIPRPAASSILEGDPEEPFPQVDKVPF